MTDMLSERLLDYFRAVYRHSPRSPSPAAPLDEALRDFLMVAGGDRTLLPGEILFRQDDAADHLYWIEEGMVAILHGDLEDPKLLAFRHAGQVVGEIALIENIRRTASVVAIDDTVLRTLSRSKFQAMLSLIPAIGIELMRMLSARLREVMPVDQGASLHDPLTGAFTRQHFDRHLRDEIEVSCMYGQSFTLVLIDLDHFGKINESQGHAYGDLVLKTVATTLRSALRGSDLLFRYGGDEFVLMLSTISAGQAQLLGMRLMEKVCEAMAAQWPPSDIGFSAGVASYPADGGSVEQLLASAESRLSDAKLQGRGRVICA